MGNHFIFPRTFDISMFYEWSQFFCIPCALKSNPMQCITVSFAINSSFHPRPNELTFEISMDHLIPNGLILNLTVKINLIFIKSNAISLWCFCFPGILMLPRRMMKSNNLFFQYLRYPWII
jgi:hypothetical protein